MFARRVENVRKHKLLSEVPKSNQNLSIGPFRLTSFQLKTNAGPIIASLVTWDKKCIFMQIIK